ncbi:hypothetical protein Scep_017182 [Stephania cephalantha]|uniref:Uncharacterized protein n=1 Tax=Stephania cephalantha TaxID=152367 RepID=A0AAP0IP37_9MAGN
MKARKKIEDLFALDCFFFSSMSMTRLGLFISPSSDFPFKFEHLQILFTCISKPIYLYLLCSELFHIKWRKKKKRKKERNDRQSV